MSLSSWYRDRYIRGYIRDAAKGKNEMQGVVLWALSHKKLLGAAVAAASVGLRSYGLTDAAHVVELVAATLFGGGLRSDAGVKDDHGL